MPPTYNILAVPDIYVGDGRSIPGQLAAEVASAAAHAVRTRGWFSIAVPGGSVATACFPALAELPLDWTAVHLFWADERAVPPSHPESNYGIAARLWLDRAGVPTASVHRMPADALDLTAAADRYAAELSAVLGTLPVLDLALLGMGPDGHVASLFPGHVVLGERERLVAVVTDAPKLPSRRLTLTLPILASVRRVIVVAFGATKADALATALKDEASRLPVAQLLRRAPSSLGLADTGAGAGLRSGS